MHQRRDRFHRVDEFIGLSLGDDERGSDLEHHEVVAADLAIDSMVAKQAHHQHLTEHRGMDARECLDEILKRNLVGG